MGKHGVISLRKGIGRKGQHSLHWQVLHRDGQEWCDEPQKGHRARRTAFSALAGTHLRQCHDDASADIVSHVELELLERHDEHPWQEEDGRRLILMAV